jgi:hypothetical protein
VPSNVREFIVDELRRTGVPLDLEKIARQLRITMDILAKQMRESPLLSDARGLTHEQARLAVEFYGRGTIFDEQIERLIEEFEASKAKLDEIERRRPE